MISGSTLAEAGAIVRIDAQRTLQPKGARHPVQVYEVSGIGGEYNLFVDRSESEMMTLSRAIPVDCTAVEGKHVCQPSFEGRLVKLSRYSAHLQSETEIEIHSDLRIQMRGKEGHVYGKVLDKAESDDHFLVHFSSLSPDASDMIAELILQCVRE